MVDNNQTEKPESLGEFLVRHRKEKKLEVSDIMAETKIPAKTLVAMEEDDYDKLPAEAFARGFYGLYAQCLELDTADVMARYSLACDNTDRSGKSSPPLKHKRVNTMAARPSMASGSALGVSILILTITIAALCYHFSWNPATFLSEKLREFQKPAHTTTQLENITTDTVITGVDNTTKLPPGIKYFLSANFLDNTTATISIDDNFPETIDFSKGDTQDWRAKEAITLILPQTASVIISLNGSPIDLPTAEQGFITLSLP